MKPHPQNPHELLEQLFDNSAALCQAELEMKAASQRSILSARDLERKLELAYRVERLVWLLMLAGSIGFGYAIYRHFPHDPPQYRTVLPPFIKPV